MYVSIQKGQGCWELSQNLTLFSPFCLPPFGFNAGVDDAERQSIKFVSIFIHVVNINLIKIKLEIHRYIHIDV